MPPPPASLRKPVLFHSAHCDYCRDVRAFIVKHGLTDRFAFFCVDTNRQQIPRFVTSVPTILLHGQMLTDEGVTEYVTQMAQRLAPPAGERDVEPLAGGGFDAFEALDGSSDMALGGYVAFDDSPSITGIHSGDPQAALHSGNGSKGGSASDPRVGAGSVDGALARLQKEREAEVEAMRETTTAPLPALSL